MAPWCRGRNGRPPPSAVATRSRSFARCRAVEEMSMNDVFEIAGTRVGSRLLMGTAGYPNRTSLLAALEAGGTGIVTMSVRRISLDGYEGSLIESLGDRYR